MEVKAETVRGYHRTCGFTRVKVIFLNIYMERWKLLSVSWPIASDLRTLSLKYSSNYGYKYESEDFTAL